LHKEGPKHPLPPNVFRPRPFSYNGNLLKRLPGRRLRGIQETVLVFQ